MINDLPFYLILCLFCTILVETFFGILFGIRDKNNILIVILVQIVTNPVVVCSSFLINVYGGKIFRNICLMFLEVSTIFIEGKIYKKNLDYKKINPFILSTVLNTGSFVLGFLLERFF